MTPEHSRLCDKYEALVIEAKSSEAMRKAIADAYDELLGEKERLELQINELHREGLKIQNDLEKALLQLSVIQNYVNEEGVSDTAKVIRVQGVVNKTLKRKCPSTSGSGPCNCDNGPHCWL